jgi:hypothetical protein
MLVRRLAASKHFQKVLAEAQAMLRLLQQSLATTQCY